MAVSKSEEKKSIPVAKGCLGIILLALVIGGGCGICVALLPDSEPSKLSDDNLSFCGTSLQVSAEFY